MLKALLEGNPKLFAVLANRAFGKLTQKLEIPEGTGPGKVGTRPGIGGQVKITLDPLPFDPIEVIR